jgi:hypothetical protein
VQSVSPYGESVANAASSCADVLRKGGTESKAYYIQAGSLPAVKGTTMADWSAFIRSVSSV